MKSILFFLISCLFGSVAFAQTATANIVGKWKTEDNTIVEIYATTNGSYGIKQVSAEKESSKKDNGKTIGKEFVATGNELKGIVIDPSDNKEYNGRLIVSADGKSLKLKVKWGFLSFNEKWIKQ
jgi:uncharacterized protein (DUF2147 family)